MPLTATLPTGGCPYVGHHYPGVAPHRRVGTAPIRAGRGHCLYSLAACNRPCGAWLWPTTSIGGRLPPSSMSSLRKCNKNTQNSST
ncbi:hypothetical protein B296_00036415 [Ensete ventricosum]|uniref:Uncharacterized protein n=1 Tax=Ensete ventricosum TaxID=4639 RepID=A0A426XSD6_ENSVE|nr:hypothetical protein B296_00036415 [Ensete ventricosum]